MLAPNAVADTVRPANALTVSEFVAAIVPPETCALMVDLSLPIATDASPATKPPAPAAVLSVVECWSFARTDTSRAVIVAPLVLAVSVVATFAMATPALSATPPIDSTPALLAWFKLSIPETETSPPAVIVEAPMDALVPRATVELIAALVPTPARAASAAAAVVCTLLSLDCSSSPVAVPSDAWLSA